MTVPGFYRPIYINTVAGLRAQTKYSLYCRDTYWQVNLTSMTVIIPTQEEPTPHLESQKMAQQEKPINLDHMHR